MRQQTSHIQQVHPSSRDLNSFVLPIHKWVPLLLVCEVMPQGEILTRLTDSDFLIQFTSFYSASLQMDVCLNGVLLVVKRLLPAPDGEYPHGTVCCCNPFHVKEAHKRCGSTYSPRQSLPAFPLAGCLSSRVIGVHFPEILVAADQRQNCLKQQPAQFPSTALAD